ncbi:MAG TPA: hypothetical protein VJ912_01225 [Candidatus Nanoarchaeia archaeon]|nr:hypothetical protein [Candidatus Nanoarchaeia archaeon]
MRTESFLFVLGFILIIVGGMFNEGFSEGGMTGFIVENNSPTGNDTNPEYFDFEGNISERNISREEAVMAINKSYEIMFDLEEEGFYVKNINDTIIEAERILRIVDYAEVLRDDGSDFTDEKKAREALEFIDWKEMTYKDVFLKAREVNEIREKIYSLYDEMVAVSIEIEHLEERGENVESFNQEFEQINDSFYRGRYNEVESDLEELKTEVDDMRSEVNFFKSAGQRFVDFTEENYFLFSAIVLVLIAGSYFGIRRYRIYKAKKDLKAYRARRKAIKKLIRDSQKERYKTGKMSAMMYNVKKDLYDEKIENINANISSLEDYLNKHKRKVIKKNEEKQTKEIKKASKRKSSKKSPKKNKNKNFYL